MTIQKLTSPITTPNLMDRSGADRGVRTGLELERAAAAQGEMAESVGGSEELRKTFQDFVGQTFFSQMIASMRSTQQEPAYFHGGQAEKIFQGQLDQILSEEISKASASEISDPMFKLFQLRRQ